MVRNRLQGQWAGWLTPIRVVPPDSVFEGSVFEGSVFEGEAVTLPPFSCIVWILLLPNLAVLAFVLAFVPLLVSFVLLFLFPHVAP
jgi:hypothetical protein